MFTEKQAQCRLCARSRATCTLSMVVPESGTVPLDTTSRTKKTLLEHRHTDILSILRTCASSSTRSIHRWSLAFAQYQNPPLPPAVANSVHPSAFLHDVVSHTLRGRRRSFGCCGSVLSTAQGSCTRDLCRDIEGKQPILTTTSCREGAAYKQGQGAAP